MSTTRQIWEWLGSPAWEPPVPKRGQQFAEAVPLTQLGPKLVMICRSRGCKL